MLTIANLRAEKPNFYVYFFLALQSLYSVIAGLFKPWILVLDKEDARYILRFKIK